MTTKPIEQSTATAQAESTQPDLVVVHQITVLDPNGKGWRTTLRIQDGWQGATLEHWSIGGSSVPHGIEKAADNARVAMESALGYLAAF